MIPEVHILDSSPRNPAITRPHVRDMRWRSPEEIEAERLERILIWEDTNLATPGLKNSIGDFDFKPLLLIGGIILALVLIFGRK